MFLILNVRFAYYLPRKVHLASLECVAGHSRDGRHGLPLEACRRDVLHIKCSNLSSDLFCFTATVRRWVVYHVSRNEKLFADPYILTCSAASLGLFLLPDEEWYTEGAHIRL
jgi:hypothetical protein